METILPDASDLSKARKAFDQWEPRGFVYKASIYLIDKAFEEEGPITVGEAISLLLQIWNQAYYRFKPFNDRNHKEIQTLLNEHIREVQEFRKRTISDARDEDAEQISNLFTAFEEVLGPVGAAKSLHLLCPHFFPLWDRAIAAGYGHSLGTRGTNSRRYLRFMDETRRQVDELGGKMANGTEVLKCLDEYNYCRFTLKRI